MKILYFITGLNKSGAETQLYNLISGIIIKKNVSIKVIALTGGFYEKKLKELGIEVEICTSKLNYNLFKYISFFKKNIEEFKPDIVHSFLFHTNIVSKLSLFTLKKKFKLICSYRDRISNYKLIKFLEKFNSNKVELLISNSNEAANELDYLTGDKNKIKVIFNGYLTRKVNPQVLANLNKKYKDKKIILTVGRLDAQKDYFTNIKTCIELKKIRNDFIFVYIGKGTLKESLVKYVKENNLENFIEFIEFSNEVVEYMNISKVFFLPTIHESQGNVFIEAMYEKLPIVTTNISENISLIKNAKFCEIKNYKLMAKNIEEILIKEYDKKLLMENHEIIIETFSHQKMIEKYYILYKELI